MGAGLVVGQARLSAEKSVTRSHNPHGAGEELVRSIIDEYAGSEVTKPLRAVLQYLAENALRMDYPLYRERGMQIGSGAMESLHRVASQMRLKLAGARWLPERTLAILNLRSMRLADRRDAFLSHDGRSSTLGEAFTPSPVPAA